MTTEDRIWRLKVYAEFYGLKESPFALTPDPRFIYFTPSHTEVMANLHYGIESGKGLVVVTGEVGTGKTTILCAKVGNEAGAACLARSRS